MTGTDRLVGSWRNPVGILRVTDSRARLWGATGQWPERR
jgi:hypothetical protein